MVKSQSHSIAAFVIANFACATLSIATLILLVGDRSYTFDYQQVVVLLNVSLSSNTSATVRSGESATARSAVLTMIKTVFDTKNDRARQGLRFRVGGWVRSGTRA